MSLSFINDLWLAGMAHSLLWLCHLTMTCGQLGWPYLQTVFIINDLWPAGMALGTGTLPQIFTYYSFEQCSKFLPIILPKLPIIILSKI